MATVVFSHGFGVRADSRGLFTDIAAAFPQHRCVLFDYNELAKNGDVVVSSFDSQVLKLQEMIDQQQGDVIVLAHSQGCVTASLVELNRVKKAILLAPPMKFSVEHVIEKMLGRSGSVYNPDGESILARSDGSFTRIPKEYIESVGRINPFPLYEKIAATIPTTIVRCTRDTVLGLTNANEVTGAHCVDIEADHDFTGVSRQALLRLLETEL